MGESLCVKPFIRAERGGRGQGTGVKHSQSLRTESLLSCTPKVGRIGYTQLENLSRPTFSATRCILMIVLDIDLDFFLNEIPTPNTSEGRCSPVDFIPWKEDEVRSFLAGRCNVSEPLPGAIVTNHDEVFHQWHELIQAGELTIPFDLIHIDSHADMGMAMFRRDCIRHLYCNLLHKKPRARIEECTSDASWVDSGNYVLFAVACVWIASLKYVHHPQLRIDLHDIPDVLFQNNYMFSDALQLKRYSPDLENDSARFTESEPEGFESEVPFEMIHPNSFQMEAVPSYLFVAHSPEYTPPTSDNLLEVFRELLGV